MSQFSLSFLPERRIFAVGEINAAIRETLEAQFPDIWVKGEISNFRRASSGHLYFTLKDAQAQLRCVFFRQNARYARFQPADGVAVVARGRIDVYEVKGEYQLLVEHLEPLGAGALQLAFEQLKKKLAAEGLFDPARKRPLPLYPRTIGLVTSPGGAVIADMLRILGRRFPGLHILLYPARVQGEGAAEEISQGVEYFSRTRRVDLVIVARGGGSLEDLWAFNEEMVARAMAACAMPVISAVGHETDFTIADFVADLRAPTPSAAAELAIRAKSEFVDLVEAARERATRAIRYRLAVATGRWRERGVERPLAILRRRLARGGQRTDEIDYQVREQVRRRVLEAERRLALAAQRLGARDPRVLLAARRAKLAGLSGAFERLAGLRLARLSARLETLGAQLAQMSPLRVLERGYALVEDEQGRLLRHSGETAPGRRLGVRLHQGRLGVEVREVE